MITQVGLSVEPAFDLTTSLTWFDSAPFLTSAACGCAAGIGGTCLIDACRLEGARASMLRHLYPPLTDTATRTDPGSGKVTLVDSGTDCNATGRSSFRARVPRTR